MHYEIKRSDKAITHLQLLFIHYDIREDVITAYALSPIQRGKIENLIYWMSQEK